MSKRISLGFWNILSQKENSKQKKKDPHAKEEEMGLKKKSVLNREIVWMIQKIE